MWLPCNNPLKKITDQFAALSVSGSCVRLHILALREMIYAQDLAAAAPILIALVLAPTSSRADNVGAVFGVLI